ncbi:glycosyltransferase [Bradyrhizobium sp. 138]|uniref:glycosyltransferase n=1 Tax=Bradyrhizobium sp. 138 TaxID=2782615 RepID=UPI001FF82ACC|nr:glycosyltransferase [Bradyrhizobium sp. 138]
MVKRSQAPAIFLTRLTSSSRISKYCFYLDQFVLLPIILFFWQLKFDAIIIGDHSNGPSGFLVIPKKLVVMVHDSIAIRGGLGQIPDYDRSVGRLGAMLQRLIVLSLRKSQAVLANPGPLSQELRELGVSCHIEVIGCPVDISRLTHQKAMPPRQITELEKFALYVGSDAGRKRKALLVDVWRSDALWKSEYKLVFAGFTSERNKRQFEELLPDRITCVNDVTEAELRWLYENCSCVITASAHEGFCIPILEAIFFEKCVITPNNPFFKEVFGPNVNAVMELDGRDAQRILSAIDGYDPSQSALPREELLTRYSFPTFAQSVRRVIASMMKYRRS